MTFNICLKTMLYQVSAASFLVYPGYCLIRHGSSILVRREDDRSLLSDLHSSSDGVKVQVIKTSPIPDVLIHGKSRLVKMMFIE
jgi:hypothetical protein